MYDEAQYSPNVNFAGILFKKDAQLIFQNYYVAKFKTGIKIIPCLFLLYWPDQPSIAQRRKAFNYLFFT